MWGRKMQARALLSVLLIGSACLSYEAVATLVPLAKSQEKLVSRAGPGSCMYLGSIKNSKELFPRAWEKSVNRQKEVHLD